MPRHKARRLRRLIDATALFDAAAARPGQGRLSELELRVWLAGSGCSAGEASRVLRLLASLVVRRAGGAGAIPEAGITYRQWAVGWPWVTHALEVYGLNWRNALL
jgi:hypothetical protein